MSDRDERLLEAFLDDLAAAPAPAGLAQHVTHRIRDERPARASRLTAWWPLAAAAAVIVAAGSVVYVIAGPRPSPSVTAVLPSSSAPASSGPTASLAPTLVPASLILLTFSPAASPSGSAEPGATATFHVTLDPDGRRLPVLVTDGSATVRAASQAAAHPVAGTDPVGVAQGPSPDSVVVFWTGGGCDLLSEVTVDEARTTVTLATLTTNQGCDAIGIDRAVALTFSEPVAASSLKGRLGIPLSPGMAVVRPSAVAFTDATHGYVAGADQVTGLAYLWETADGGRSWTSWPIGWGTVTGLTTASTESLVDGPLVAISCAAGGDPPDTGCVPGVYLGPGPGFTRLSDTDPAAVAAQGSSVAVLVNDPILPNASYPFPPRHVEVSADVARLLGGGGLAAGQGWQSVPSPCPDLEATGIALDAQGRALVVCEGGAVTGTAHKTLYRATDGLASAWTKLPAPPDAGTQFQFSIASDGTGLMWGPRSPLLTTTDAGAHWAPDPPVADGDARIVLAGSALPGDRGVVLVWNPDHTPIPGVVLELVTWHGLNSVTEMAVFPPMP